MVRINTNIPNPNEPYPEIELYSIELNGQPQTSEIDIQNIKIPWKYNTLVLRIYIKNYTTPIHLTDIHVTPPWYKTNWFVVLCCICIAGGVIAGMFIFNTRKEIRIQKRLKEYRQYLNEKKIDFLIHINHELRTPLTLIYSPLKRLIEKSRSQDLPQYLIPQLQSIFNQAQHMREIVDMVLDWNSIEASYSKLKIQRNKLRNIYKIATRPQYRGGMV